MIKAQEMSKQVLNFQKSNFNSVFNNMVIFYGHVEQITNSLTKNSLEEEPVNRFLEVYKQCRDEFKIYMKKNFEAAEDLVGSIV